MPWQRAFVVIAAIVVGGFMLIFGVWSLLLPFVVLMLLSEKAKSRSVGLLGGVRGRVGGAVALFAWLNGLLPTQDSSGSSLPAALINMVVGVLLVVLALREWRGRPAHRLARYEDAQRIVFGRNTYQTFAQMLGSDADEAGYDLRVTRMRSLPATVVSTTLDAPLDWPDATVANGDAVDVVARLGRNPRCRCARPAACR